MRIQLCRWKYNFVEQSYKITREKSATINFPVASQRIFLRKNFYSRFFFSTPVAFDLSTQSKRGLSWIRASDLHAGLFLHASHAIDIALIHRGRVQFRVRVHGVSGELVRPPSLAHRETQEFCAWGCFCPREWIDFRNWKAADGRPFIRKNSYVPLRLEIAPLRTT